MPKGRLAFALGCVVLALLLARCASDPSSPAAPASQLPAKRAVQPAPGQPTLGDVVDETMRRREVIEQLEEIERAEP